MLVLIFSLVDYPLRMPALSCVFALLCACLLPTPVPVQPGTDMVPSSAAKRRSWTTNSASAAGLAALAAAAVLVLQAGVSAKSLLSDDYAIAQGWAPWSTTAHEVLADDALAASNPAQASEEALKALSSLADRRTGPSRRSDGASSSRLRGVRSAADGNGSLSRLARSVHPALGNRCKRADRRGRQGSAARPSPLSAKPFPAVLTRTAASYARRSDGAVTGRDPFLSSGVESELCEGGSAASPLPMTAMSSSLRFD